MKEKSRLSRLTEIITQLQSKRLITATFLAEKYQVSTRTIYRDIRTLENAGIPVFTEEGKGYSLMEGYQLPPIMFSEEEANALITAEKLISKNKDTSFIEEYKNAITKIKAVLKNSQKKKTELLSDRIIVRQHYATQKTSNYLMMLQNAITSFQLLEIEYTSLKNVSTKRKIEPFALYSTQENWLLIAFCRLRKDFRAFRIDHIEKISRTDAFFTPHNMTLETYFKLCYEKQQHTS